MPRPPSISPDILNAALVDLEAQRAKIDDQIAQIHRMLPARRIGGLLKTVAKPVAPMAGSGIGTKARKKRVLSQGAHKRIAAAQKKRWAAIRKDHEGGAQSLITANLKWAAQTDSNVGSGKTMSQWNLPSMRSRPTRILVPGMFHRFFNHRRSRLL